MIESKLLAGLAASLPLIVLAAVYVLLRGQVMAALFQADESFAHMTIPHIKLVLLAMLVPSLLVFGLVSGVAFGLSGSPATYLGLTLGAATLMSIAAIATRTPMMADKIVLNYVVAVVFGLLVPFLAA